MTYFNRVHWAVPSSFPVTCIKLGGTNARIGIEGDARTELVGSHAAPVPLLRLRDFRRPCVRWPALPSSPLSPCKLAKSDRVITHRICTPCNPTNRSVALRMRPRKPAARFPWSSLYPCGERGVGRTRDGEQQKRSNSSARGLIRLCCIAT